MTQHNISGALEDIAAHTRILELGAIALVALGNITNIDGFKGDDKLDVLTRSELAGLFAFFGEVMRESAIVSVDAVGDIKTRLDDTAEGPFNKRPTQLWAREWSERTGVSTGGGAQ